MAAAALVLAAWPALATGAVPADAEGCFEPIAFFQFGFEYLRARLPPGFEPRDAGELFGTPAPLGLGSMFVNAYTCDHLEMQGGPGSAGGVGIFVETPDLGGEPLPPGLDFYVPIFYSSGETMRATLEAAGVRTHAALAYPSMTLPGLGLGETSLEDDRGIIHAFSFAVEARTSLDSIVRLWHATEDGLAWLDLDFVAQPMDVGAVTSCAFREGSFAADMTGRTSCAPGDAMAVLLPEQAWEGTFRTVAWSAGASG